ncbi:uncharacterized protein LOC129747599 [Uranotaenia lowii]|uniref:uncharacterized protein LOC129747599 n=1 Tax=Uranotaenia lowii TaxID=190385 RepID=UPI002479D17D|nr:uncharacterized protein LOC129747599 [Uranotaenia lowii]
MMTTVLRKVLAIGAVFCAIAIFSTNGEGQNQTEVAQEVEQQVQEKLQHFREVCINASGSDEGYLQFIHGLEYSQKCIPQIVDMSALTEDIQTLTNSTRAAFAQKYCPQFNLSVPCFGEAFDGLAKCSGKDQPDKMKTLNFKIIYSFVDAVCRNDGLLIMGFLDPKFSSCLPEFVQSAFGCGAASLLNAKSLEHLTEQQCRDMKGAQDCMREKVEKCQSESMTEILDAVLQPIKNFTNCKNLAE